MSSVLIEAYRQAENYFFSGISTETLSIDKNAIAYMTEVPVADLNLVYVKQVPESFIDTLNKSKMFFASKNLSFVVIMPDELCSSQIDNILIDNGYCKSGSSVAMVCDVNNIKDITGSFNLDPEISIKSHDVKLNDWMLPLVGAFDSTKEISSIYASRHEVALTKNVNLLHYSLYKNNKPIASITLSIHDNIARIDDVGTLPEYQKQGYATLLIKFVLIQAIKMNAKYCFLESSASGLGVYEKLGFKKLFENNIYTYGLEQFRKTELVPYNSKWPTYFINESARIKSFLSDNTLLYHIGSTSVPNMLAKPVVDIMVLVDNISKLDACRSSFEKVGYNWMGEYGIPGRRYLWKIENGEVDFHLQCFQFDHLAAKNCIIFRNYLRANKNEAQDYAKIKQKAAKAFPNDTHAYWHNKKEFVESILNNALQWHENNRIKNTIATENLEIREINASDLVALYALLSNKDVMRYSVHGPYSEKQTEDWISFITEHYKKYPLGMWAITEKDNDVLIGICGLMPLSDDDSKYEIGYRILPDFQGKGYATEAAIAVRDYAVSVGITQFIAYIEKENKPSIRISEKIGMHFSRNDEYKGIPVLVYEYNQQIQKSINLLTDIFDKDLLGVYLYGSYVVGGLQRYSDIDLFVLLDRASTSEEKSKLAKGLLEISGIYMQDDKPPIEMTLVEKSAVNPWQYPPNFDFQYGEWLREDFKKGNIEPWQSKKMPDLALLITQVLLASITLVGDAPEKLLCKVPYHDFISAITDELPNLVSELDSDTRNVLLTLARIWNTVSTNSISSKPVAASLVINNLPEEYKPVLARAKSICQGDTEEYWDDLIELLKPCADFMLAKIKIKTDEIKSLGAANKEIKINTKEFIEVKE